MLGETNSVEEVDAASYLEELCRDLIESVQKENGISIALKTDIEREPLPVDRAIPLGLIVNELVTNAIKYAFPSETSGTIVVTLKRTGRRWTVAISDGRPRSFFCPFVFFALRRARSNRRANFWISVSRNATLAV
jgi:two-component sensor histidine kinase